MNYFNEARSLKILIKTEHGNTERKYAVYQQVYESAGALLKTLRHNASVE